MRRFGAALAMGMLLATAACGGDDGGSRPSVDEVAQALTKGGEDSMLGAAAAGLNDKGAECLAKALVDSKLSSKSLRAIVEGDKDYEGSEADTKALSGLTADMTKCVTENLTTN